MEIIYYIILIKVAGLKKPYFFKLRGFKKHFLNVWNILKIKLDIFFANCQKSFKKNLLFFLQDPLKFLEDFSISFEIHRQEFAMTAKTFLLRANQDS